ncbi:hypothetical protein KEM55_001336, partial [Ascosphaera atra]
FVSAHHREHEKDLPSLLRFKTAHNELYSNAVQILNSMKTHPSCNRLAASDLIVTCQSMHGHTEDGKKDHRLLDFVKSLYAARLALCELEDAGARLPDECMSITSKGLPTESVTRSEISVLLESCLRLLESKPQWWTSYSNNRQNAAIMCEAARIEIEKDEQLHGYKKLANATSLLSDLLNEAFTELSNDKKRNAEFSYTLRKEREALMATFFEQTILMKNALNEILRDVEHSRILFRDGDLDLETLTKV